MRYYSATAGVMTLTAGISPTDASLTLDGVVGLPTSYPFSLVLDPGESTEEIVQVTGASGTTLTVTRGFDGTSAQSHALGGSVRHMMIPQDLREPQQHIAATANVHGVSGDLVGETEAQTLTNKTLEAATAATPAVVVRAKESQTANVLDAQRSTGASMVSVKAGEGTLTVAGTTSVNDEVTADAEKYVAEIRQPSPDVVALQVDTSYPETPTSPQVVITDNPASPVTWLKLGVGTTNVVDYKQGDGMFTTSSYFRVAGDGTTLIQQTRSASGAMGPVLTIAGGSVLAGALSDLLSLKDSGDVQVLKVDGSGNLTAKAITGTTGTLTGTLTGTVGTFSTRATAPNLPRDFAAGTFTVPNIPAGTSVNVDILFDKVLPGAPVHISIDPSAGRYTWTISSKDATGCTVSIDNHTSGAPGSSRTGTYYAVYKA